MTAGHRRCSASRTCPTVFFLVQPEVRKVLAAALDPRAEHQERRATSVETSEGMADEWLELRGESLTLPIEAISLRGARM